MLVVYMSSGIASAFSSAAILLLNGFGFGAALFLGWVIGSLTVGSVAVATYLMLDHSGDRAQAPRRTGHDPDSQTGSGRG